MADDTLVLDDSEEISEFTALAQKISGEQTSSDELDADIENAVRLFLEYWLSNGNSQEELPANQDFIQQNLEGFLGTANAAAIATELNLYLNKNAQYNRGRVSKMTTDAAEPVNLATGQFIYTVTDFVVAGAGLDFAFARTYKSGALYQGILGANWDHAYNLWLRDNGNSVTVTTGGLRPVRYVLHQFFPYYLAIGDDNIIVATPDNAFEQRSPAGQVVRFEQVGDADGTIYRVIRVAGRFGNTLQFSYDDQNRLSKVLVNHPTRTVEFTYDDQSRIQTITLFPVTYATELGPALIQRSWTYIYDEFSDLVAVTSPSTVEFPAGRTIRYTYSSQASFAQRQHDLLSITDPNGTTYLENEYGNAVGTVAYGKVVRQRLGSGVFLFDYAQVIPDSGWSFTDANRPTSCVTVVQRDGHPVRYILNAMGNILAAQETILSGGAHEILWRNSYDADGRRTGTLSPEGRLTQTYYGREDFYRRQISPGDESLPMWQDANLSANEHARFSNVIATVSRSTTLGLVGLLADLLIYGDVFPDILVVGPDDIIVKRSYENSFQQLATVSDPRYTSSPDPAAAESQDPRSPYSTHLTVMTFNGDPSAMPAAITYPDTTYPAPLPNGATGVRGAHMNYDAYDGNGRLLHWTDPEGNAFAFGYFGPNQASPTTEGFLASSIAGVGVLDLRTSFAINEAGQVVAATDPLGNTTHLAIDAFSLVRTVSAALQGYQITYFYDGNAQVVSRASAIIDPDGSVAAGSPEVATFAYNDEMSPVLTSFGDSSATPMRQLRSVYDTSNRMIRSVMPRGNSICYEYDERSLMTQVTLACCAREAANTAYDYDHDGLLVSVRDPRGNMTTTRLDAFGRPVGITDPLGNLQRTDYDKLNNGVVHRWFGAPASGTWALLRRTEYQYDERGQMIRERKAFFTSPIPTADPWGAPDTEFDSAVQRGKIQWYDTMTYLDGNRRTFRVVDANGRARTTQYDVANRRTTSTDPAGNADHLTYDAAGNVVRRDRHLVDTTGIVRAVISTVYEFDPLNRLKATIDGAGNRVVRGLDSRSLLRTLTDGLGHVTEFEYNGFRDQVAVTEVLLPLSGAGTDSDITTSRSFDANSNVVGITDPAGNTTAFEYDLLDRPTSVINPDGTSRTLIYDRSGNRIDQIDEEGLRVSWTYDAINRLTGTAVQRGSASPRPAEQSAQFSYDGVGALLSHANDFLSVARNCDSLGRCYQETLTFRPPLDAMLSPLTILRQFDAVSNRIGLRYPSGQTLSCGFGPDDRFTALESKTNAGGYPGDPSAAANRSIIRKRRWGDLTVETQLGNGVTVASSHDAAGRQIADDCSLANGYSFLLEQLWDAAGNRALAIERSAGNAQGWWHWYDSTNRLVGSLSLHNPRPVATNPLAPPTSPRPLAAFRCQQVIDNIISAYRMNLQAQPEYSYDSAGNRTSERTAFVRVPYRSNARNEYLSAGSASFLYDRAGRLVKDAQFTFFYNFRGQLIQAVSQLDGIVVLQIFHDATGRQIGIIEGARIRVFALDGATPIESYDDGALSAVYMWEDLDRLCFFAANGKDQYVLRDVLESTRLTSDASGAAVRVFRYDVFGKLLDGAPESPILYSGKYLYEAIGWYEYGRRQYIPALGRFAQPDPAGFVGGANLYTYVGNNPLSARDPSGTDRKMVGRAATEYEFEPTYITASREGNLRETLAAAILEETPAVSTEDEWVSGSVPPSLVSQGSTAPSESKRFIPADLALAKQTIRYWALSESLPSFLEDEIGVTGVGQAHQTRVAYTVNSAILEARETLVNLNKKNLTQYDVLKRARGIVTVLRNELPGGSESILLRDAERFLWGRVGVPYFAREGIYFWGRPLWLPESLLDMFAPVDEQLYNVWKILRHPRAGTGPMSARGGTEWFLLGLHYYRDLDILGAESMPYSLGEPPSY